MKLLIAQPSDRSLDVYKRSRLKRSRVLYLNVAAVCREVQLQDESRNITAVNQSAQARPTTHVIHVHRVIHRADCQQAAIRAEAGTQTQRCKKPVRPVLLLSSFKSLSQF